MIQKVNQKLAHDQWHQGPPKFGGIPKSAQKQNRDDDHFSEESYHEEEFEDADDVERLRIAMEKEKAKAQQHITKQQPKEENRAASRLKFGGGGGDSAPFNV